MKLLINASVIRSQGGVGLLGYLLPAFLRAMPSGSEILLYLNPELTSRFQSVDSRVRVVSFHPQNGFARFWWEQIALPAILRREKCDQLLSFGNTGPLFPGCAQILYVQQSIPYTGYQPPHQRLRWRWFQFVYGFLMGVAQLGASRIVAPTGWLVAPMRRSVAGLTPAGRYVVSPPGLPVLSPDGELSDRERELLARVSICKSAGHNILFYPAYLAPYKHLPYLLQSVALLRQQNISFRLLLTFDQNSDEYFPCKQAVFETCRQLNMADEEVIFAGSLSAAAVARAYALADALVFPSLVETLGLPLLEAMAAGVPVVACKTPFARELCGEAALYADESDPAGFAACLQQLFSSPAFWQQQADASRARGRQFSWEAHARAILGL